MKNISLNIDKALGTVTKEQVYAQAAKAHECNATLQNGNGAGNDFLGWLHLPSSITDAELTDIENTANVLRSKCEVVVAIGIGGSYLGTKAVVEALNNSFDWLHTNRKNPVLVYAGHNIGEDYLYELCEILKGKQFGLINISKSGTTTEPALAFRMLKKQLEDAVGKEEDIHYSRQRRRSFLRTDSSWFVTYCRCRYQHPRFGCRSYFDGKSNRRKRSFC